MKIVLLMSFAFLLAACTSGSGGGTSTTSYKYKISGAAPLMILTEGQKSVSTFASNFILKWNETSGVVAGIYTDDTTNEVLVVTGTSNGSGRQITATRTAAISGVKSFQFAISQTGDINGTISATLTTYDENSNVVQTQSVNVVAETTTVSNPSNPSNPSTPDPLVIWDNHGKIACYTPRGDTTIRNGNPATMMIDKMGDVYAWGNNAAYTLGLGSNNQTYSTPTKMTFPNGAGKITFVSYGNSLGSAAIDENHKLYGWGYFTYPTTGNAVNTVTEITNLPSGLVPEKIYFSKNNMYIIDVSGTVWTAGGDTHGQMGNGAGDSGGSTTFVQVPGLSNVDRIIVEPDVDNTVLALKKDGTLWGWGQSVRYQLSEFNFAVNSPTQLFSGLTAGFTHVSRDYSAIMAVHTNGKSYTWGGASSSARKMGRNTVGTRWPNATDAFARMQTSSSTALTASTALTTGMNELTVMAGSDGKVYKWGANYFGDGLGNAIYTTGRDVEEVSGAPDDIVSLKGCGDMIYAVQDNGTVIATGSQRAGAIGDGQTGDTSQLSFSPVGTLDLFD